MSLLTHVTARIFGNPWRQEAKDLRQSNAPQYRQTASRSSSTSPEFRTRGLPTVSVHAPGMDFKNPDSVASFGDIGPRLTHAALPEHADVHVRDVSHAWLANGRSPRIQAAFRTDERPGADPAFNVSLEFNAFPDGEVARRTLSQLVDDALEAKSLPPTYRKPLLDALTQDFEGARKQAKRRGYTDRGLTYSACFSLVPASVGGAGCDRNAAILKESMLRQGSLPRIVNRGPCLETSYRTYKMMGELQWTPEHTVTRKQVADYFYKHMRDEYIVAGLINPRGPLKQFTEEFVAFARRFTQECPHVQWRSSNTHRAPSTFDSCHGDSGGTMPGHDPLSQLMDRAARDWTPTHDIKEQAYRFICIMQAYDAHLALEASTQSRHDTGYDSESSSSSVLGDFLSVSSSTSSDPHIYEDVDAAMNEIQQISEIQARHGGKPLHTSPARSNGDIISTRF